MTIGIHWKNGTGRAIFAQTLLSIVEPRTCCEGNRHTDSARWQMPTIQFKLSTPTRISISIKTSASSSPVLMLPNFACAIDRRVWGHGHFSQRFRYQQVLPARRNAWQQIGGSFVAQPTKKPIVPSTNEGLLIRQ